MKETIFRKKKSPFFISHIFFIYMHNTFGKIFFLQLAVRLQRIALEILRKSHKNLTKIAWNVRSQVTNEHNLKVSHFYSMLFHLMTILTKVNSTSFFFVF